MKKRVLVILGVGLAASLLAQASTQTNYGSGSKLTGALVLTGTVNLMQLAEGQALGGIPLRNLGASTGPQTKPTPLLPPPNWHPAPIGSQTPTGTGSVPMQSLSIGSSSTFGLLGLTHADQRNANAGNQFSVEPPNASIAVGDGMVLEGVNNAVQVYDTYGNPLLPAVLSSNQVFGVSPAINRATGVNGVFPTDMRVFYDQTLDRFFVIQRAQDNDAAGNELTTSHLYMAVSQTGDPTGTYNIYVMDTTDGGNTQGCSCYPDYPQIGADAYGLYIASNEFNSTYNYFVDAQIFAISKASLAANATAPTLMRYLLSDYTGFEFAIQPVTTPIGASYYLANGGGEFFVSTAISGEIDNQVAVWLMTNTSSLSNPTPNTALTRINTDVLAYTAPWNVPQMNGPIPYGNTFGVVQPSYLDGGDQRLLSAMYAGGRIYATWATLAQDELGNNVDGAAYVILSPTYRGTTLSAPVLRQGYLLVQGNHLLRPAIGVTAQGRGAITVTLTGNSYWPTAAYVPITTYLTSTTLEVVAPGAAPEDGFTGYEPCCVARWGDYNSAAVADDGSIWMVTEFIPNAPRTQFANWGTYITQFNP